MEKYYKIINKDHSYMAWSGFFEKYGMIKEKFIGCNAILNGSIGILLDFKINTDFVSLEFANGNQCFIHHKGLILSTIEEYNIYNNDFSVLEIENNNILYKLDEKNHTLYINELDETKIHVHNVSNNRLIKKVQRKSDGKIFTDKDYLVHNNNIYPIKHIHVYDRKIFFNISKGLEQYDISLNYAVKIRMFKTYDNFDITYDHYKVYILNKELIYKINTLDEILDDINDYKIFYLYANMEKYLQEQLITITKDQIKIYNKDTIVYGIDKNSYEFFTDKCILLKDKCIIFSTKDIRQEYYNNNYYRFYVVDNGFKHYNLLDKLFCVNVKNNNIEFITVKEIKTKFDINDCYKLFFDKEKAEEFINNNNIPEPILFITEDNYKITNEEEIIYFVNKESLTVGSCSAIHCINVNNKSLLFATSKAKDEYIKNNTKPILVTHDGVPIFVEDNTELFGLYTNSQKTENTTVELLFAFNRKKISAKKCTDWLIFSTNETRQEYINNNQPFYSKKQINDFINNLKIVYNIDLDKIEL